MFKISCYIGPRYNGTRLYNTNTYYSSYKQVSRQSNEGIAILSNKSVIVLKYQLHPQMAHLFQRSKTVLYGQFNNEISFPWLNYERTDYFLRLGHQQQQFSIRISDDTYCTCFDLGCVSDAACLSWRRHIMKSIGLERTGADSSQHHCHCITTQDL